MDWELADRLGREIAWAQARASGLVTESMAKEAGLVEGILFAPLSGLAALLSSPMGSKLHGLGMGLLMGAGVGALAGKEVQNRQQRGEQVNDKAMSPAMQAIMAGLAIGGTSRVKQDLAAGKPVGSIGAMLTGAPLGALLASDSSKGFLLGGIAGNLLSVFGKGPIVNNPFAALMPGFLTQKAPEQMVQQPPQGPQAAPQVPPQAQQQQVPKSVSAALSGFVGPGDAIKEVQNLLRANPKPIQDRQPIQIPGLRLEPPPALRKLLA